MPDPGISPNCPYCGRGVRYVRSDGDTHFYKCPRDGPLILPPNGRLARDVTVPPIDGSFTDAVRALLDTPILPKGNRREKKR